MCHRQWPPPLYACPQYASIALIIAGQQAQERCHCRADEMAGSGASSDSAAASQDLAASRPAAGGAAEAGSGDSSDDSSDAEEASPGGYESEGVPLAAGRRHLHPAHGLPLLRSFQHIAQDTPHITPLNHLRCVFICSQRASGQAAAAGPVRR